MAAITEFGYIEGKLYNLTLKCSRCGHIWHYSVADKFDDHNPKLSNYIDFKYHGHCERRERAFHIDCQRGCSHPPIAVVVFRTIKKLFTGQPIFGYGEIIKEEIASEYRVQIEPSPDAAVIIKMHADGIRQASEIIASTFKKTP